MSGNSLLIQVAVAGIAIGIIVTFIQPTLAEISERQVKIAKTMDELEEINNVNQRLDSLHTQLTSIPQSDKEALFRYLPDKVDEVQVLKDLIAMVRDSRLLLSGLTYDGASSGKDKVAGATKQPFVHTFSLNFLSSYSQMKEFLLRLERNDYPLVVSSLSASPNEGGLIDVSLTLLTYAHNE